MTKEEIYSGLLDALVTVRPTLDIAEIVPESELYRELGLDSLSMLLLAVAVENKFGIRFDSDKPLNTVSDIVDCICDSMH